MAGEVIKRTVVIRTKEADNTIRDVEVIADYSDQTIGLYYEDGGATVWFPVTAADDVAKAIHDAARSVRG